MTDQTPEISLDEFASRHPDGLTVDVRERAEYAEAHVPGAVLVPMSPLTSRMDEIDHTRTAGGTQGWIDSGRAVEACL